MSVQFCMRVGENIKKYRREKGLTLKQLADMVGLTESTVQKYENGNIKTIDSEMLKKLADAFGVLPEDIAGWEKANYEQYQKISQGTEEANVIKAYSQLTHGHKKAVRHLMENLLECQEKYNSDK